MSPEPNFVELTSRVLTKLQTEVFGTPASQIGRVAPGDLVLNDPQSMFQWYNEYVAVQNYAKQPQLWDPMGLDFGVLIWCSLYKGNAYCYDNIIADLKLGNGTPTQGIYQYVDVFTWEGFLKTVQYAAIYWGVRSVVENIWTAVFFAIIYSTLPTL